LFKAFSESSQRPSSSAPKIILMLIGWWIPRVFIFLIAFTSGLLLTTLAAPGTEDGSSNTIILSQVFYDEINQHRIPVERHAVAAFAHSPGVLDFYIWLVWKCWTARQHGAHVPLFSQWGLVYQLGTREYSDDRFFRRKINFWLRHVKALWPGCSAHVSDDGDYLLIEPSRDASPIKPLH
jgi:hypothetical protein